ncbi:MAG: hypothetical protein M1282_15050 [Chloroflexi bacterium]|nr:hypothetical protein [Chloroflexota bacterium]
MAQSRRSQVTLFRSHSEETEIGPKDVSWLNRAGNTLSVPPRQFHRTADHDFMADAIQLGDRVRIYLDSAFWKSEGWFNGIVVRIDPYTKHRNFYWVELNMNVQAKQGGSTNLVSVLNPKHIAKTE